MADLPSTLTIDELRSADPRVQGEAWRLAFPLLWQAAPRLLNIVLAGPEHVHGRKGMAVKATSELFLRQLEKISQLQSNRNL